MKKILIGLAIFSIFNLLENDMTLYAEDTGIPSLVAASATTKIDPKTGGVEDASYAPGNKKYNVSIETFDGTQNASGNNGVELITNYIGIFYKAAASIIGLVCVLIIVISGAQITMGGLDPEGVNQAKDRILQAIFSMILLFGSAVILKTINPGFFI